MKLRMSPCALVVHLKSAAYLLVVAVRSKHVKSVHVDYYINGPGLDVVSYGFQSLQKEAFEVRCGLGQTHCLLEK